LPLANALDLLGERWTLLIVRDLLFGAKRYKDLLMACWNGHQHAAARCERVGAGNHHSRRVLPPPAGSTVYELTA